MFNIFSIFWSKKKKYFKTLEKEVQRMIWEQELSKFSLLQETEITRQRYDQSVQALESIKARIEAIPPTEVVDEKLKTDRLNIEKVAVTLKTQLDVNQGRLKGSAPSEAFPDGTDGIENKLIGWVNRKQTIKNFIKHNC